MNFMYVGAGCFIIATAALFAQNFLQASHNVTLYLQPLVSDEELPAPIVTVANGEQVPYQKPFPVSADLTVIVNLTKALERVRALAQAEVQARTDLAAATVNLDAARATLDVAKASILTWESVAAEQTARLASLSSDFNQLQSNLRANAQVPTWLDDSINGIGANLGDAAQAFNRLEVPSPFE